MNKNKKGKNEVMTERKISVVVENVSAINVSINNVVTKGNAVMKKANKVKATVLTVSEVATVKTVGKSEMASLENMRKVFEAHGIKTAMEKTVKNDKGVETVEIVPVVWTEKFSKSCKGMKLAVKPLWIECGMDAKGVDQRFSKFVKSLCGISMQKQTKKEVELPKDGDDSKLEEVEEATEAEATINTEATEAEMIKQLMQAYEMIIESKGVKTALAINEKVGIKLALLASKPSKK